MIRIAMLDDERPSVELFAGAFRSAFSAKGAQVEIMTFTSPEAFVATLSDTRYDLICLDVIMEPMLGTEVAAKVREKDADVPIVFISSNENKVFSCFAHNPVGFIRKTNFFDDATSFVDHYLTSILPKHQQRRNLLVKSGGDTILIDLDQILYIEGNHNYQSFYLKEQEKPIEVRELISSLEEKLKDYGFIRVHKGFIVNSSAIYKLGNMEIVLINGKHIPISQQRRDQVFKAYLDLTKDTLVIH